MESTPYNSTLNEDISKTKSIFEFFLITLLVWHILRFFANTWPQILINGKHGLVHPYF